MVRRNSSIDLVLVWEQPTEKHGELQGFRLRYGIKDGELEEKFLAPTETTFSLVELGKTAKTM